MSSITHHPLISVIIPTYNNEDTLKTAVDSILNQTYAPLEVIIVNDGSTDATRSIADTIAASDRRVTVVDSVPDPKRYDTRLKRNINAGYSARNTGLAHARGELITFQDADDASLKNRIEIQYGLLTKYKAMHVMVDWFQFTDARLGSRFDITRFQKIHGITHIPPEELYALSQKTKGWIPKMCPTVNRTIPFYIKRWRYINRLFFGSLDPYPGTGNSPLFRREVVSSVSFRSLQNRLWPSFMGRGADRDFNFQVAETFRQSHVFLLPLYMWRQKTDNERYKDMPIDSFLLR